MNNDIYDAYRSFLDFGLKLYTIGEKKEKAGRTRCNGIWYLTEAEYIIFTYGLFHG
jgi:hypothetical protein